MDYTAKRREMVDRQLRARHIFDRRVLDAFLEIPREEFVSEFCRDLIYNDDPVAIGYGQTISQPYITALMAQCLELKGHETVLDIGSGSGFHAAVLGALAARVISVEVIPELAREARANLERTGRIRNVQVFLGDASAGWPRSMPYDAISVAAAAAAIPPALIEQLADPGRLVIPVGPRDDQDLTLVTKSGGRITSTVVTGCRFVPLVGRTPPSAPA